MDELFKVNEGELKEDNAMEIAKAIVKTLDSKRANDIKVLKIDNKTIIADYFVICTGNSTTQIKTLADEVEFQLPANADFVRRTAPPGRLILSRRIS